MGLLDEICKPCNFGWSAPPIWYLPIDTVRSTGCLLGHHNLRTGYCCSVWTWLQGVCFSQATNIWIQTFFWRWCDDSVMTFTKTNTLTVPPLQSFYPLNYYIHLWRGRAEACRTPQNKCSWRAFCRVELRKPMYSSLEQEVNTTLLSYNYTGNFSLQKIIPQVGFWPGPWGETPLESYKKRDRINNEHISGLHISISSQICSLIPQFCMHWKSDSKRDCCLLTHHLLHISYCWSFPWKHPTCILAHHGPGFIYEMQHVQGLGRGNYSLLKEHKPYSKLNITHCGRQASHIVFFSLLVVKSK